MLDLFTYPPVWTQIGCTKVPKAAAATLALQRRNQAEQIRPMETWRRCRKNPPFKMVVLGQKLGNFLDGDFGWEITLQGTNISPQKWHFESMIFLFPRWDMLIPWRVNPASSERVFQLLPTTICPTRFSRYRHAVDWRLLSRQEFFLQHHTCGSWISWRWFFFTDGTIMVHHHGKNTHLYSRMMFFSLFSKQLKQIQHTKRGME